MLMLPKMTRKDLVAIAKADSFAAEEVIDDFCADMVEAGLYDYATEAEIERLDEII